MAQPVVAPHLAPPSPRSELQMALWISKVGYVAELYVWAGVGLPALVMGVAVAVGQARENPIPAALVGRTVAEEG